MSYKVSSEEVSALLTEAEASRRLARTLRDLQAGIDLEAYALSLAAVELLLQESSGDGVRNLLRNPDQLPQVTADLDRKLGL